MKTSPLAIGFLLFPRLTQLDLTGPYEIFQRVPGASVHLAWKDLAPVRTESGFGILPTVTFDDCPPLDVLVVPGGFGQVELMRDEATLDFLRKQAAHARYVTAVCTGSLLLGAAGLLQGYRATTHWGYVELLPKLGAIPTSGRVVRDRNRITAGGVTAGIDFALTVVSELLGEAAARKIQLAVEYDPAPPFDAGRPERSDPAVVAEIRARLHARHDAAAPPEVRFAATT
jgi:cyclohexyl-isocyanide hydratase